MKNCYPEYDEFKALADQGNMIPVYRELMSDALTPVTAYRLLAEPAGRQQSSHSFLFESGAGNEQSARYSFVGVDPEVIFTAYRDEISIKRAGQDAQKITSHDPLEELQKLISDYRAVHMTYLPRFTGGLVGYAGYDMVRYYENIGEGPADDRNLPDLLFGLYRTMVIFDHVSKTIKVVANAHVTDDPEKAYAQAVLNIEETIARLRDDSGHRVDDVVNRDAPRKKKFTSNFEPEKFREMVDACKEYIRAGDIFQVVGSQRLTVDTDADSFDIYRALRLVNPSPFMFMVDSPEVTLVGASPEILCRVEDQIVTNRPLAGTRRRGKTEEDDLRLEADLLADPKELSEHRMLVDLARNDVGMVAEPGSIKLDKTKLMAIERYSHVMHISSEVTGKLAEGMTAFDALRAALPVGTVSGAPKIRAMEIIDEFEPTRRGPYAGAVGYVDFCGNMDTCIALRTMVIANGKVYLQAGAGFVADSVPQTEYEETMNKASAMLKAIDLAEDGKWSER